jgi:acyl-CoA dehydrogenase
VLLAPRPGRRASSRRHLLSGILACDLCGHGLYARPHAGGRHRYVCVKDPGKDGCGKVTITAAPADEEVRNQVLAALDSPGFVVALLAAAGGTPAAADDISAQLRAIDARREDLAQMWAAGEISRKEWLAARDQLTADALTAELSRTQHGRALAQFAAAAGTPWERWATMTTGARRALVTSGDPHSQPPVMEELKAAARERGLWNLFLPDTTWGAGLSNTDYAPLAEILGRSLIAPEALNCSAPDTGNMELLVLFGTEQQQRDWLVPLLDGTIRSCFAMTEPAVSSSDASNISATITRDGDEFVLNGRKWWTSGILNRDCKLMIFMGCTDPDGPAHSRQSMVLVPTDAPGITVLRGLPVFGYTDRLGHGEVQFTDVRVPAASLLGTVGGGFAMAQARLGPGRVHHAMRAIGMAERALELMCRRAASRVAFGGPLADQGVVREWIARSRIEIDQARLLVLHAAWLMDRKGNKAARTEVAEIKVAALDAARKVIDRALQAHGGAGVSNDFPLARMYTSVRALRIADGPDEVHLRSVARRELAKYRG